MTKSTEVSSEVNKNLSRVIQIDEERIQSHLGQAVWNTVSRC